MGSPVIHIVCNRIISGCLFLLSLRPCAGQSGELPWTVSFCAAGLLNVPLGERYIGFPDTSAIPFRDVDPSYSRSEAQAGFSWQASGILAKRIIDGFGLAVGVSIVDRPTRYIVDADTLLHYQGTGEIAYSKLIDHRYRVEGLLMAEFVKPRWRVALGIGYTFREVFESHRTRAIDGEKHVERYINHTGIRGVIPFAGMSVVPFRRYESWWIDFSAAYRGTRKFGRPGLDFSMGISFCLSMRRKHTH